METDIEKGFVDTVGEGKSGMNGESNIDIYTLRCIEQNAGHPAHQCQVWEEITGEHRIKMQAKAEAVHGVQRQQRRHGAELSSARTTQRRTARRQSGNSVKNT